ncbi:Acyl-CoA dehydrogenase family member 11 [Nymphon striatum]|nr:Acyl-CoA dehydrogenase family member 11 [Nymphon striatum]
MLSCVEMKAVLRNIIVFNRHYHRADIGSFFQEKPSLTNTFLTDKYLISVLCKLLPSDVYKSIETNLSEFGEKVVSYVEPLGDECEKNVPTLHQYSAWGDRIDEINTCSAWKKMKDFSAEEGLIATAYEKNSHQWSRIHQLVKMYLFSPSSGLYSCPLAMTDGAAKIFEKGSNNELVTNAFRHLTSRCPRKFWTSGQWMTERQGAGGTDTCAILNRDNVYNLYGYKWFSSATDSDVALTLARIVADDGSVKSVCGTEGLSLFFLETHESNGKLNNIQVKKLKNKLGTRQLPTAELLLDGTTAIKISDEGRGVAEISSMLTLTRIHNAVSAISTMRRILMLATDYSKRRKSFGKFICDYPLHVQTLSRMELETRGSLHLFLHIAKWLGLDDCNLATDRDILLLRLLTPIIKLYTAKQAMNVVSEGLESFGGQGYIEDTGLPRLLRDAQVLPIWEGTTNILSLDVLRSIAKTKGEVLLAFNSDVKERILKPTSSQRLTLAQNTVLSSLEKTLEFCTKQPHVMEVAARDISFSLARIYIGSLLIEHSLYEDSSEYDIETAYRWCCTQDLSPVISFHKFGQYEHKSLQYDKIISLGHLQDN